MTITPNLLKGLRDPVRIAKLLWPKISIYGKQREILYSLYRDDEIYVPGANQIGKDFILSIACLIFFLTRHPCRVITTSAKDDHLRVLWGEIKQRIQESAYPLDLKQGGPLHVLHHEIRKVRNGVTCPLSYMVGMVASDQTSASMQGHHIAQTGDGIPRTLFAGDECSSVPDVYYRMASTWANRMIFVGNTWPCNNFFRRGIKGGDVPRDKSNLSKGYHRRVIRITVEDSPNVRYARTEQKLGKTPSNRVIIPGVKTWSELQKNLALWDETQKNVSLWAKFHEGGEERLYPEAWLNYSEAVAEELRISHVQRKAKSIGIDPGEGGDKTAMCAIDELGIIELVSKKTPNTAIIPAEALAFMRKHQVPPEKVFFDRGGGGKQHADILRQQGFAVNTVAFGESIHAQARYGRTPVTERKQVEETRYVYVNRRAEMFGNLSIRLDPSTNYKPFAIPQGIMGLAGDLTTELRHQLEPIPKTYDKEGRLKLLPKNKRDPNSDEDCLITLIGHSPDELDALVLAVYGLTYSSGASLAGVIG